MSPLVTYATNEEIQEALKTTNYDYNQPSRMMLDVYTYGEKSKARPVLVGRKLSKKKKWID